MFLQVTNEDDILIIKIFPQWTVVGLQKQDSSTTAKPKFFKEWWVQDELWTVQIFTGLFTITEGKAL